MDETHVVGIPMQEIVDHPEWQELRASLVGTWKKTPDKNLLKLKKFLHGSVESAKNRRLLILYNYLTSSAFRIGIIYTTDINNFKRDIMLEIRERKKDGRWV